MFILLLLAAAFADPPTCVHVAERPREVRVTIWDLRDGPVTRREQREDAERTDALVRLRGYCSTDFNPDALARIATLYAEAGRFAERCEGGAGASDFDGARRIGRVLRETDLGSRWAMLLRARADAACGLGQTEACLRTLDAHAQAAPDEALPCERAAWAGDLARRAGDHASAREAYAAAPPSDAPLCRYVAYQLAVDDIDRGDVRTGIEQLTALVRSEAQTWHGPPASAILAAAVLELRALANRGAPGADIALMEAERVTVASVTRIAERLGWARLSATSVEDIVQDLRAMGLTEAANAARIEHEAARSRKPARL